MKLSSIIRQARNGELKSLSSKDKTDEVIVDYLNMALTALYSRFNLKTDEIVIPLVSGKSIYRLDGIVEGTASITDIDGSPAPLTQELADNLIMLIGAYDELGPVTINDDSNDLGIYTISYNSVQVPTTINGTAIALIYRAKMPDVVYQEVAGAIVEQTVSLPPQLLEPVLHYIGYRAHGSLDGNIQAENNTHLMRYEASCKRAVAEGMLPMESLDRYNTVQGFLV